MTKMQYRQITPDDFEQKVHVAWKSFAPMSTEAEINQGMKRKRLPDEAGFAAFDGDRMAAKLILVSQCENRIRGAQLSFGAVAGVSTLPEYRRERLVAGLFRECFAYMNQADIVFSALSPFSVPFYEKFGYADAAQLHHYRFPASLLKPVKAAPGIRMREYDSANDLEAVMDVQRSMSRFGSRVFVHRLYLTEHETAHRYVLEQNHAVIGFVEYEFGKTADGKALLTVNFAWFLTDECLPAIVDLTYRFASQCEMIEWKIDPEIPLEYYILEPGRAKRTRGGHMMIRVVKFREFCQRIKVPVSAAAPVTIHLTDVDCPWNEGVYKLTPVSGRLEVENTDQEPEIHFDALHLSHAVGGQLTAILLQRLGGFNGSTDAVERFTQIFPPDSYVSYIGF